MGGGFDTLILAWYNGPTTGVLGGGQIMTDAKVKKIYVLPLNLRFTTVKTDKTLPLILQFTTKPIK
jgi:hypothetical protein